MLVVMLSAALAGELTLEGAGSTDAWGAAVAEVGATPKVTVRCDEQVCRLQVTCRDGRDRVRTVSRPTTHRARVEALQLAVAVAAQSGSRLAMPPPPPPPPPMPTRAWRPTPVAVDAPALAPAPYPTADLPPFRAWSSVGMQPAGGGEGEDERWHPVSIAIAGETGPIGGTSVSAEGAWQPRRWLAVGVAGRAHPWAWVDDMQLRSTDVVGTATVRTRWVSVGAFAGAAVRDLRMTDFAGGYAGTVPIAGIEVGTTVPAGPLQLRPYVRSTHDLRSIELVTPWTVSRLPTWRPTLGVAVALELG